MGKLELVFFKRLSDIEGLDAVVVDGSVRLPDRLEIFHRFNNGLIPRLAVQASFCVGWRLNRTTASVEIRFLGTGWQDWEKAQAENRLICLNQIVNISDPEDRLG